MIPSELREALNERLLSDNIVQNIEVLEPSLETLKRLEDAIFEHGEPYKSIFFDSYVSTNFNPNLDEFLTMHETRKEGSLRYCWEVLGWRPSNDGKKIIEESSS